MPRIWYRNRERSSLKLIATGFVLSLHFFLQYLSFFTIYRYQDEFQFILALPNQLDNGLMIRSLGGNTVAITTELTKADVLIPKTTPIHVHFENPIANSDSGFVGRPARKYSAYVLHGTVELAADRLERAPFGDLTAHVESETFLVLLYHHVARRRVDRFFVELFRRVHFVFGHFQRSSLSRMRRRLPVVRRHVILFILDWTLPPKSASNAPIIDLLNLDTWDMCATFRVCKCRMTCKTSGCSQGTRKPKFIKNQVANSIATCLPLLDVPVIAHKRHSSCTNNYVVQSIVLYILVPWLINLFFSKYRKRKEVVVRPS